MIKETSSQVMHVKPALITLITAVEQSCLHLEAQRERAPMVLGILLRQRRRMHAMLRAILRWHGLEPAVLQPAVTRHGPAPLHDLCNGERRLLAFYDAAIAQAQDDAPELRLLMEQRAEAERAHEAVFALMRSDGATAVRVQRMAAAQQTVAP